ncbi:MAG TPA: hypothetical protein VK050_03865 [Flavobacteriaceae bacterium]|nr:hypothetical protein [Flavobacteriaceae bacterium]
MRIHQVKKIITNNISLIILLLGALSNFLLILFLRKDFPDIFTPLSLYLTYLGILGGFGFLGFDQVYLRLAHVTDPKPSIGINIYIVLLSLMLLVPIGFAFYFARYEFLDFWQLYISGVSINAIMLGYNANRLNKKFSLAQGIKNSFKVFFLIGAWWMLVVINSNMTINSLFFQASILLLLCGSISFLSFLQNTQVKKSHNSGIVLFAISFGLNIALITVLGFGERILIADKINEETFASYFYYLTIFLFPLTLLQEYVGFKELVYFKEKVDKAKVYSKIVQLIGLGIVTYLAILLVVWIDNGRFLNVNLANDYILIAWMSLLGLVKLVYSLFSAILGARGKTKGINTINIVTALLIGVLWFNLHLLGYSLNGIVISLILVFLYRSIHTYFLYVR